MLRSASKWVQLVHVLVRQRLYALVIIIVHYTQHVEYGVLYANSVVINYDIFTMVRHVDVDTFNNK